jgi:hypothetical protein
LDINLEAALERLLFVSKVEVQTMPEDGKANSNSDNADKNVNRAPQSAVWTIVAAGIVGVVVIGFVAILLPNMTERVKFFTTNALSILVLDVIVVQAYIYRKQWAAMQASLRETRSIIAQNERAVEIAQQNMICAQRAYLSIALGSANFANGGDADFVLRVENAGNTPANDVEMVINDENQRPAASRLGQKHCRLGGGRCDWTGPFHHDAYQAS